MADKLHFGVNCARVYLFARNPKNFSLSIFKKKSFLSTGNWPKEATCCTSFLGLYFNIIEKKRLCSCPCTLEEIENCTCGDQIKASSFHKMFIIE